MKNLIFIIFGILFLNSCIYDNEESLYGISDCDINYVSYEMDISPIISSHCTMCHGGSFPAAELALETYDQIYQSATDYDGIIDRISRSEGDPSMMPGSYRIPQCQIDKIVAWVEQGALNN
ncbi:MAG: hypothetical protein CM15mP23_17310 [Cryomorphaceae bacterium]|nr:MAG: hypothetical protein CM15mP23_17310 [Cryomorphaceae bacterium]|tara:strand:- start:4 stop:366 length:363 start_codon:yes stop_codon:yes gene_type:complete